MSFEAQCPAREDSSGLMEDDTFELIDPSSSAELQRQATSVIIDDHWADQILVEGVDEFG